MVPHCEVGPAWRLHRRLQNHSRTNSSGFRHRKKAFGISLRMYRFLQRWGRRWREEVLTASVSDAPQLCLPYLLPASPAVTWHCLFFVSHTYIDICSGEKEVFSPASCKPNHLTETPNSNPIYMTVCCAKRSEPVCEMLIYLIDYKRYRGSHSIQLGQS